MQHACGTRATFIIARVQYFCKGRHHGLTCISKTMSYSLPSVQGFTFI